MVIMKILFIADMHIELGKGKTLKSDKVPKDWQTNRFISLAEEVKKIYNEHGCDLIINGGDVFHKPLPNTEETDLYSRVQAIWNDIPEIIYSGNHEMITKKLSCLSHLEFSTSKASNLHKIVQSYRSPEFDIIGYQQLKDREWEPRCSDICFTHVRGTIEPHVVPEIDLQRFVDHGYKIVFAGDLHSHTNTQEISQGVQLVYPGSPLTTTFHRERTKGTNGVLIIDTDAPRDYKWIELGHLPQLLRKTITVGEDLVPGDYDHIVYEVEGNVVELKSVANEELLDKKKNIIETKDAKLDMSQASNLVEECALYWRDIENLSTPEIEELSRELLEHVNVNT